MSSHRRGRHRKETLPIYLKAGASVAAIATMWAAFTPAAPGSVAASQAAPVSQVSPPSTNILPTTSITVPQPVVETTPPVTTAPPPPTSYVPVSPALKDVPAPKPAPEPEPEVEVEVELEAAIVAAAPVAGIAAAAAAYVGDGIPYVWGGKDRSGMDCSGFVWNVLKDAGESVPYRNSSALRAWVTPISASDARPGDLVFWPGHVGVYIGDGRLVDAAASTGTVTERSVWSGASYGRIP